MSESSWASKPSLMSESRASKQIKCTERVIITRFKKPADPKRARQWEAAQVS